MRRNFELFDDRGGVFKIPVLRTKRVRLQSSARPSLFLSRGDAKKESIIEKQEKKNNRNRCSSRTILKSIAFFNLD